MQKIFVLVISAMVVAGCAARAELPPLTAAHPASPQAKESAPPDLPSTLTLSPGQGAAHDHGEGAGHAH